MKWLIPSVYFLLAGVSVVTLKSIAPDLAIRQFLYFALGGVILIGLSKRHLSLNFNFVLIFYWLSIALLILLLVVGRSTRSTVRWIDLLMGFKIQPSQFIPLLVALLLSARPQLINTHSLGGFLHLLSIILLPVTLVFLQPDFSTSVVVMLSVISVLILKPPSKKKIMSLLLAFLCVGLISWLFLLKPYQKNRVLSFVNMSSSPQSAASYNARQALIAVGSGGLWGRGIGAGVQSHLRFLPERQTDFIFASIAEEWGLVGSLLVLGLYTIILMRLIAGISQSHHLGKQSLLIILFFNLLLQIVINIGMNVGLLPITGLTLPLLSYGGSSILAFSVFLGLANQILVSQPSHFKLRIK